MAWHVNPTVKLVLGILGNITALGLFLSPVPTFRRIVARRDVEDYSPVPYAITFLNCLVWTFYGLPVIADGRTLVATVNGVGVGLEAVYLSVFVIYAPPWQKLVVAKYVAAVLAFFATLAAITLAAVHGSRRSTLLGIVADIITIAMYSSPLTIMRLVMRTRSVEFMPFYLSLNAFLNGVAWTTYAIYVVDVYIIIPNAVGALLGATQLLLYARYCRHDKTKALPLEPSSAPDSESSAELVLPKTIAASGKA